MAQADCRALTINGCMGTIMPLAETTACLTLSLLNDAGYLAFCESDFVVIPAGILLANISGRPVFLNDPTYPHDGIITLAHCTAPRRMDGDSRSGADHDAFRIGLRRGSKGRNADGETVTIIPDFKAERWTGLFAEIRGSAAAHLPFANRCPLSTAPTKGWPGRSRFPLDHGLRRPPPRGRLRLAQNGLEVGQSLNPIGICNDGESGMVRITVTLIFHLNLNLSP